MLSWLGLVKQVLPSRDSCWMVSANGAVVTSSPGEGRTTLQTIVLPRIRSSSQWQLLQWSSQCSLQQEQQQLGCPLPCSSSNKQQQSSYKEGQPAAATTAPQQRTKGHIYYSIVHCKLKTVVLIKGNSPTPQKKTIHFNGQTEKNIYNIIILFVPNQGKR